MLILLRNYYSMLARLSRVTYYMCLQFKSSHIIYQWRYHSFTHELSFNFCHTNLLATFKCLHLEINSKESSFKKLLRIMEFNHRLGKNEITIESSLLSSIHVKTFGFCSSCPIYDCNTFCWSLALNLAIFRSIVPHVPSKSKTTSWQLSEHSRHLQPILPVSCDSPHVPLH